MAGLALLVSMAVASIACVSRAPVGRKVIVLGFDGLDHELTAQMLQSGRLPALAKLAAAGQFAPLGTTVPPQSPVAWSTFITGLDPGGHGIFDFIHRDPKTMTPFLSTTRTEGGRTITLGPWRVPLSGGRVELLRQGQPFWDVLEARGIPTTIIRMPANFPPSGTASRELSGMGTPDLLGTYGTFSFFTSEPYAFAGGTLSGGEVIQVRPRQGVVEAILKGPDNPFRSASERVEAPFTVAIGQGANAVTLTLGREERVLKIGEWSDWLPVEFPLAPTQSLSGEVRFFLKALDPFFELYASPVNIDPLSPAMPVSTPTSYAADLAEATGRFYTQGMPEDTKALKTGVLTTAEFLAQAAIAGEENIRQYAHVLDGFTDGFLFYYFGNVDQVGHMMWHSRDPQHPTYRPERDAQYLALMEQLYQSLDRVVADTQARLGPDDLLVVMSDHGFTTWRRAFNLNSWLRDEGYLAARDPKLESDPGYFTNVDWSRTRAYGLGLNGLYLNLQGRERDGIVPAAEREALVSELRRKLLAVIDPATGQPAITKVYRRDEVYTMTTSADLAPDLIIGYAKGTRTSDESALGGLPREVLTDNTTHWTGDHCMDHEAVPGVLFSSRPLKREARSLQQLAAALLAEFDVETFPAGKKEP
jgi:predicted AlkP superfamily phosphohydrolase/phosphomutase